MLRRIVRLGYRFSHHYYRCCYLFGLFLFMGQLSIYLSRIVIQLIIRQLQQFTATVEVNIKKSVTEILYQNY